MSGGTRSEAKQSISSRRTKGENRRPNLRAKSLWSLMSSHFSVKPVATASTHFRSPSVSHSRLVSPLSLSFRGFTKNCNKRLSVIRAEARDESQPPPNGKLPKSRREILLEYVKNVQPDFMELFLKRASPQVVDAMRQTVTNMIGSLPPQFFAVTVSTVAENLAQLMYSVMMTGYMFRNAQYRVELQQSLVQIALPEPKTDLEEYAPGTQKKVTGEVIRWNNITGAEKIDAVEYIELLEKEIEELNQQVSRMSKAGPNQILDYLKSLEPQNLKELTNSAGEDVVFAMNTFIKRLLAISDPAKMRTTVTESSAAELANLLYWLMIVGYSMRNIEVRFDMERVLGTTPKLQELPPGENI